MITYETAIRLKEIGFPQKDDILDVYYPSLDEIILACGKEFMKVELRDDGKWAAMANIPEEKRCSHCPSAQTVFLEISENIIESVALVYLRLKS